MKSRAPTLHALLWLAAGASACSDGAAPKPPQAPDVIAERVPAMPEGHPDLGSLKVASRAPRRMSIEQLQQSLDSIANLAPGTVKLPPDLAVTLGQPDYYRVTEESLDPSPLFMKFMVDLATVYCSNVSDAEANRPAAERLMTRFATVDENLAFMLLRFTGLEGADGAPALARLKTAHERASRSAARPRAGYEAACIALVTSPEFLLY